jgi:hypothetical protein
MRTTVSRSARRIAGIATLCLSIAAAFGGAGFSVAAANAPSVCAMLSASNLRSWFGKEMVVRPNADLPQARGCQWVPADGSVGGLVVTIAPARYYVAPKLGAGFKALSGIGDKAYIVPSLGGWEAGAVKGTKAVGIRTPSMSQKTAITLLKTLVGKM